MPSAYRDELAKTGFVVVRSAFDPRLAAELCEELARVHHQFPDLKRVHPSMHKLGEWSIRSPHLASLTLRNFVFSGSISELVQEFMGDDVDLFWVATAAKPREKGKAFPWHQDAGYGGPKDYVTFWIAFDSVDEENGCLWAVPGSHREGIHEHELRKSDDVTYGGPFIKGSYPRAGERIPVRLSPGDLVCMDSKLVHASFQNHSQRYRRGLITAFIRSGESQLLQVVGPVEGSEPYLRRGQIWKEHRKENR